jgi:hypothetical protein
MSPAVQAIDLVGDGSPDSAAGWEPESGFDREVVGRVWALAQPVPGNDPEVWRKDQFGAWIHRAEHANRRSEFGWEIAEFHLSTTHQGISALRPMQWQNYLDFVVADRQQAAVSADGLRNARRLV